MDQRGNNCCLLQEGNSPADHAHVKRQTPMQTKKAEIENDPMYRTEVDSGLGPRREAATTKARRGPNSVRPLDGGFAK
jgi:hypothetical protein